MKKTTLMVFALSCFAVSCKSPNRHSSTKDVINVARDGKTATVVWLAADNDQVHYDLCSPIAIPSSGANRNCPNKKQIKDSISYDDYAARLNKFLIERHKDPANEPRMLQIIDKLSRLREKTAPQSTIDDETKLQFEQDIKNLEAEIARLRNSLTDEERKTAVRILEGLVQGKDLTLDEGEPEFVMSQHPFTGEGVSTPSTVSTGCPPNWVKVPGNPELGTTDFCVMKYEAKNVKNVATSQSTEAPWVNIPRGLNAYTPGGAWKACRDLGAGFDLIANAQWQTIARNIEGVQSNWDKGTSSGGTALNRGHSDGSPYGPLPASSDNDPCYGTGNSNCANPMVDDFTQKRTHVLSNGGVIWDIAGNVWESTQDTYLTANNIMSTNISRLGIGNLKWGPKQDHSSKPPREYGGLGYAHVNIAHGPGTTVVRGANFQESVASGVFSVLLYQQPTESSIYIGFRCVLTSGSGFVTPIPDAPEL